MTIILFVLYIFTLKRIIGTKDSQPWSANNKCLLVFMIAYVFSLCRRITFWINDRLWRKMIVYVCAWKGFLLSRIYYMHIFYVHKEAVQHLAQNVCGVTASVYPTHQTYHLVQQMLASLMICQKHYQLSSRKNVREQQDMFGSTRCI